MGETLAVAGRDLSIIGLFQHADIVVKSIMIGLLLASIVCWALIFEKVFRIWRLNREVSRLESAAQTGGLPEGKGNGLVSSINTAAQTEWREGGAQAAGGELRDRLETSMRVAMKRELKGIEKGLPFLATLGSAAPFIGLFGTVWGIMNSFRGLASVGQATLAQVAPGIAEALIATAIGLFAAIPAVVAYNRFQAQLDRINTQLETFAEEFLNILQRQA